MTEISWSIAQKESSGNANSQLLLLEGSSAFVFMEHPPPCLLLIYNLSSVSYQSYLFLSPSFSCWWQEIKYPFTCIAGIYVIRSQMAAEMSNWVSLHVISCSCCFCSQRWREGSQQQPGADGQRGICLGGIWVKSTGMGCVQPHSGFRPSAGQQDHRNGFVLACP